MLEVSYRQYTCLLCLLQGHNNVACLTPTALLLFLLRWLCVFLLIVERCCQALLALFLFLRQMRQALLLCLLFLLQYVYRKIYQVPQMICQYRSFPFCSQPLLLPKLLFSLFQHRHLPDFLSKTFWLFFYLRQLDILASRL